MDYKKVQKKYFIENRIRDFTADADQKYNYYFSKIYDCRDADTIWHRAEVKEEKQFPSCSIYFYSCSHAVDEVRAILQDGSRTPFEKIKEMEQYRKKTIRYAKDCLLHEIKDRYLWYVIECYQMPEEDWGIQYIKLYFPKESLLSYLPEVYSYDKESADFLGRFLCIFQTLQEEMDEKIDLLPKRFLPEACMEQELYGIAEMLGEELYQLWDTGKLRRLLKDSARLNGYRGTKQALMERITLFTGEIPFIAERFRFDMECMGSRKDFIQSLYGTSPYIVTVLVREECMESSAYVKLRKVIEDCIPAHLEYRLVTLKPFIFLDSYTYMGLNSILMDYIDMDLGGSPVLPYTKLS